MKYKGSMIKDFFASCKKVGILRFLLLSSIIGFISYLNNLIPTKNLYLVFLFEDPKSLAVNSFINYICFTFYNCILASMVIISIYAVLFQKQTIEVFRQKFVKLFVNYFLYYMVMHIGFLLLVIPGIYFSWTGFLFPLIALHEGKGFKDSYFRSRELLYGIKLRSFITIFAISMSYAITIFSLIFAFTFLTTISYESLEIELPYGFLLIVRSVFDHLYFAFYSVILGIFLVSIYSNRLATVKGNAKKIKIASN